MTIRAPLASPRRSARLAECDVVIVSSMARPSSPKPTGRPWGFADAGKPVIFVANKAFDCARASMGIYELDGGALPVSAPQPRPR